MEPLFMLIKTWAKSKGLNDAAEKSLSSYSYANLTVFFLQTRQPPVLPCLHKGMSPKTKEVLVENVNVSYLDPTIFLNSSNNGNNNNANGNYGFKLNQNKESVAELLFGFFDFYSKFDFENWIIDIRRGEAVQLKSRKEINSTPANIYIQDPFIFDFNPSKSLSEKNFIKFNTEVRKAAFLLSKGVELYGIRDLIMGDSVLSLSSKLKSFELQERLIKQNPQ